MVSEPHKCDHCNRAFGSANEKQRHMELAHREETAMTYQCTECERTFDTQRGLEVHVGRKHSKMARTPKAGHPWKSPAVMPDTAPEQKVNPGEEPIPDVGAWLDSSFASAATDYRAELLDTLVDLAICQVGMIADADTVAEVGPTLARIKAVVRDV